MKKTFLLEGLDCAHCAQAVEDGVRKIEGVKDVKVNFLTTKMVIEADDDKIDAVCKQAVKVAKKVEPDVEISEI